MNNFREGGFKKRGNDFGGRPKFGGGGRDSRHSGGNFGGGNRGGRPQGQQELFSTMCDACHKSCEVPFRPNGEKPVYCRDCFGKRDQDDSGERRGGRSEYGYRDSARTERTEYGKPHRENRPAHTDTSQISRDSGLEDLKQQLTTIESRLNRILDLINPPKSPARAVAVVAETVTTVTSQKERAPKVAKTAVVKKEKIVVAPKVVKKVEKKVVKKTAVKAKTKAKK